MHDGGPDSEAEATCALADDQVDDPPHWLADYLCVALHIAFAPLVARKSGS